MTPVTLFWSLSLTTVIGSVEGLTCWILQPRLGFESLTQSLVYVNLKCNHLSGDEFSLKTGIKQRSKSLHIIYSRGKKWNDYLH